MLPRVGNVPTEEELEFAWTVKSNRIVKKARDSAVSTCGTAPIPVLLSLAAQTPNKFYTYNPRTVKSPTAALIDSYSSSPPPKSALKSSGSAPALRPRGPQAEYEHHLMLEGNRERVRKQLLHTPANLFARSTPEAGGHLGPCSQKYWDAMRFKEAQAKKKLMAAPGRRTSLTKTQPGGSPSPPTSPKGPAEGSKAPDARTGTRAVAIPEELRRGQQAVEDGEEMDATEKQRIMEGVKRFSTCLFDVREGFRVIILGTTPAPLGTPKVWPPKGMRKQVSPEEILKVYFAYRDVVSLVESRPSHGEDESVDGTPRDGFQRQDSVESKAVSLAPSAAAEPTPDASKAPKNPAEEKLVPMAWASIMVWVQGKSGDSEDARLKAVCAAMLRALKHYRTSVASREQQRNGIRLDLLFRWIWPTADSGVIIAALTQICQWEFEKIRQPEPPVLSDDDKKQMEQLYKAMDLDSKGYLTPFDIAGGDPSDIKVRLSNTIDPETVKEILGDCRISLVQFKEMMCEDGVRGHDGSTRVVLSDGSALVEVRRPNVNIHGWLRELTPPEEVSQRRLIDSIESEVVRWKRGLGE
eukprot:TRINITY_DN11844_c0_g1_i2.p1 TRINITY_DN11844_c0_g1~~TRINITY_DN11844_c0_g1_i2.p1  ORF type:complete len:581 (+),score=145.13 TRINITY_DN11844_c0_g1_i2:93-1835(+)